MFFNPHPNSPPLGGGGIRKAQIMTIHGISWCFDIYNLAQNPIFRGMAPFASHSLQRRSWYLSGVADVPHSSNYRAATAKSPGVRLFTAHLKRRPVAIVKDGKDKTFCLSGTDAYCNDSGLRIRSGQAVEGFFLVQYSIRFSQHSGFQLKYMTSIIWISFFLT